MDAYSACHFGPALRANNGLPLACGCKPHPPDSAMQPGSVDYPDLINQVKSYVAGSRLNDDQIHAVLLFDLIKYDDKQPNGMPTRESIQRYANVFDRYFFRGLVFGYGRCDLGFWHGLFHNRGSVGLTTEVRGCVTHKQIHAVSIRLDPEPVYCRAASIDEHINKMLCVLIHEMCHAILLLYACKCHTSVSAYLYYFGIKGHGVAFERIYLAIMIKANVLFDLNFDKIHDWDPIRRLEEQTVEDMYLRARGPINRWKWRNI